MEKELELQEIKGFIRRRKKVFILSFLIVFMIGLIVALSLTPIYTSEAVIRIEDQEIPENIVQATITDYAEERIEKISQQILSRPKLLDIIEEFDLYPELKGKDTPTELVTKMRKNIAIETIAASMQSRIGTKMSVTVAFTLAYDGEDPVKTQKVADRLSKLFLEEDIKVREKRIAGTTDFLSIELNRLGEEINNQEKIISEFKQNHLRELPEDRVYNLQAIARLQQELDKAENRLQYLQERKVLLETRLANIEPLAPIVIDGEDLAINPAQRLKRLRLELASMQSIYSEKHPNIRKKRKEILKLEQEVTESEDSVGKIRKLKQLEIKLASAKSKLGSKHPDVKALQREIAILRKQVDNLVDESAKVKISEEKPDNPIYISLKTQVETTEMEIRTILNNMPKLLSEVDEYQIKVSNAPIVEKELSALTRNYNSLQRKYSEISNKLLSAELTQEMEGKQKGERFTITSTAYLPEEPTKPNRLIIIVLSVLLAFGIGTAMAVFQEYVDDSIKTPNQLKELTNIPVFSAITYVESREDKRQRRVKQMIWAFAAFSCIAVLLLLVDQFVMKLDHAWEVVIERIMLLA
jgi:protein tyrosine kinase modulator